MSSEVTNVRSDVAMRNKDKVSESHESFVMIEVALHQDYRLLRMELRTFCDDC